MCRSAVISVLAALVLASCGGDDRITRTQPRAVTTNADGTLSAPPSPLTLSDVDRYPSDSVERAFMAFWFCAQWGCGPVTVSAYADARAEIAGRPRMLGAFLASRADFLVARPHFVARRTTSYGTLVAVSFASSAGPPAHESFVF